MKIEDLLNEHFRKYDLCFEVLEYPKPILPSVECGFESLRILRVFNDGNIRFIGQKNYIGSFQIDLSDILNPKFFQILEEYLKTLSIIKHRFNQ